MTFTELSYSFLGLLPSSESLSVRGRRLQETAAQRRSKTYAPDVVPSIQVEAKDQRLSAYFTDSLPTTLVNGEQVQLALRIENQGSRPIGEIWLVPSSLDEVCIGGDLSEQGMSIAKFLNDHFIDICKMLEAGYAPFQTVYGQCYLFSYYNSRSKEYFSQKKGWTSPLQFTLQRQASSTFDTCSCSEK